MQKVFAYAHYQFTKREKADPSKYTVCVCPKERFQESSCLFVKIIKNTKFGCEVSSKKLGAIYCRRTRMKIGVKTLKTAEIYVVMNKTCCMVDCREGSRDRGICPVLSSPPLGIWQIKCHSPREFAIHKKEKANSVNPGGWGSSWNWLMYFALLL